MTYSPMATHTRGLGVGDEAVSKVQAGCRSRNRAT
jgi:hypothetical protein